MRKSTAIIYLTQSRQDIQTADAPLHPGKAGDASIF
jgi:hypothetical protein